MTSTAGSFQRARRPEQIEARRVAILSVAEKLLRERPVSEISLRELSSEVGLAKSNVLRYFDSREAIFLEVLDKAWRVWLDDLEQALHANRGPVTSAPHDREIRVASMLAESLAGRRLLCELIAAMAGVLESNITVEFARTFKRRAAANSARLAELIRNELPVLDESAAQHFAGAVFVIVAGLWPYATPTPAVAAVTAEMGLPPADESFEHNLREGLGNQLVGLVARSTSVERH
jgi:AcrR family transcriptional regulator